MRRAKQKVADAIAGTPKHLQNSVFEDQEVNWATHPNNVGHNNSPGCFRCHDGKHLNAEQ